MPRIDLCFQGWLRGVEIENVMDTTGVSHDVSLMSPEELVKKLSGNGYFVSLASCMGNALDEEVEIFDFAVTK